MTSLAIMSASMDIQERLPSIHEHPKQQGPDTQAIGWDS